MHSSYSEEIVKYNAYKTIKSMIIVVNINEVDQQYLLPCKHLMYNHYFFK